MKKADFKLYNKDIEYEDYWFRISGESKDKLTQLHMEQSLVEINEVVYSKVDDIVGVRLIFPFNNIIEFDYNPQLRDILLKLIEEYESCKNS